MPQRILCIAKRSTEVGGAGVDAQFVYDGEENVVLGEGEGAWIPVAALGTRKIPDEGVSRCVLPSSKSPVETVPGLWDGTDGQGMICVVGNDVFDTTIEPGTIVGEVVDAVVQTKVCQDCGCQDTEALLRPKDAPRCKDCGAAAVGAPSGCARPARWGERRSRSSGVCSVRLCEATM